MKTFCAAVLVLCAIATSHALDKAEAEKMAQEILTACKDQEGGTDADYEKLMKFDYPGTASGNCMIACGHEKMGIFINGKLNKEAFVGYAKMVTQDDPVHVTVAEEIADACGNISGERCTQAVEFDKCVEAQAKARNIAMPEIL